MDLFWDQNNWQTLCRCPCHDVEKSRHEHKGRTAEQWFAMLAPAGTPAGIVNKSNGEMVKMIAYPPFAQRLMNFGAEPQSSTPAELSAHMRKDSERWARVIKGLKAAGTKFER